MALVYHHRAAPRRLAGRGFRAGGVPPPQSDEDLRSDTREPPARLVPGRCRRQEPRAARDPDRRHAARQAQARVHATATPATSSVVVNAEKVAVTGRKLEQKTYFRHSGYPGRVALAHARRDARPAGPRSHSQGWSRACSLAAGWPGRSSRSSRSMPDPTTPTRRKSRSRWRSRLDAGRDAQDENADPGRADPRRGRAPPSPRPGRRRARLAGRGGAAGRGRAPAPAEEEPPAEEAEPAQAAARGPRPEGRRRRRPGADLEPIGSRRSAS